MTFSKIGRIVTALVASAALGLGMTACGGGTIGYMWIIGTAAGQSPSLAAGAITGYKIDDYTGNLTAVEHSPFSSGGSNPQMLVVKPGGRYLYVVNSGVGEVGTPGTPGYVAGTGASIEEFSVGGSGILTPQNTYSSQGTHPVYVSFDSTGNFLYVLDKFSKYYCVPTAPATSCPYPGDTSPTPHTEPADTNGSITAFSVASDTGRLTLVPNTTILEGSTAPSPGTPTDVFEVGPSPIMARVGSSTCLYTLTANAVYPYIISSGTGQLTLATTGPQQITNSVSLTSINTSAGTSAGSYLYITDGGANAIYAEQASATACTFSTIPSSVTTNIAPTSIPVNSLTSANGKYLYVINHFNTVTGGNQGTAGSTISAYNITPGTGALQILATDGTNNPYAVGSGPDCIVEDPSNQYIYTANNIDSTVTGKLLDVNRGTLADLQHGSTFPTVQNPTCLAVSGNI